MIPFPLEETPLGLTADVKPLSVRVEEAILRLYFSESEIQNLFALPEEYRFAISGINTQKIVEIWEDEMEWLSWPTLDKQLRPKLAKEIRIRLGKARKGIYLMSLWHGLEELPRSISKGKPLRNWGFLMLMLEQKSLVSTLLSGPLKNYEASQRIGMPGMEEDLQTMLDAAEILIEPFLTLLEAKQVTT